MTTENDPGTTEPTTEEIEAQAQTEAPAQVDVDASAKAEGEKKTRTPRAKAKVEAAVSVEQAAEVLGIYASEVHAVEETESGTVVTTVDGHRYLLKADSRQEPPHEGFDWLTKPAVRPGALIAGLSED